MGQAFHFYSCEWEQFLRAYHQRSNVESTFSAIKRKFGDFVRSKTPAAQVNELLLKFIAHNIVCVIHTMQEMGINANVSPAA
jgi:transposase